MQTSVMLTRHNFVCVTIFTPLAKIVWLGHML